MSALENHPQYAAAIFICKTLKSQSFKAVFAGGCVRDALLGRIPRDIDVATDALPEQIEQLFPKTVAVGKAFGVIQVVTGGESIEVATFRKDGEYQDGRRPDTVTFSKMEEDAQRRDFTVNALFFDPDTSVVLDYVQGKQDLQQKLIRAVGDPALRFQEDHLRILRAIRFQAQLQFSIEAQTLAAIWAQSQLVSQVSAERVFHELDILMNCANNYESIESLFASGVFAAIFLNQVCRDLKLQVGREMYEQDSWLSFIKEAEIQFGAAVMNSELIMNKLKVNNNFRKDIQQAQAAEQDIQSGLMLKSWGAFMENYFQAGYRRGCLYHARLNNSDKLQSFERVFIACSGVKPQANKRAKDFPELQGEALGVALKSSYWQQLEAQAAKLGVLP